MKNEVTVVGAGLFGCTAARILAEAGFKVKIVEKRAKLGGNCSTHYDNGIEVHDYGCHIFHTDNEEVWNFIGRFTDFNQYQHHAVAKHGKKNYFLPFNLMLLEEFFGMTFKDPASAEEYVKNLIRENLHTFKIDPANPKNLEEQATVLVGANLYNAFVKQYTAKQWNCDPRELDASIIKRIPIRYNYNVNYYDDRFQGIPLDGYMAMFERMISHENINVEFEKECSEVFVRNEILQKKIVVFTGAPDELFDYELGTLSWRSLRFETESLPIKDFQGNSVVNYVDFDPKFTRIHEYKHYHPEDRKSMNSSLTIIQREFPDDWRQGKERYYPISSQESNELHARYLKLAEERFKGQLVFGGRLGMYKYFDMDDTVLAAMRLAKKIVEEKR